MSVIGLSDADKSVKKFLQVAGIKIRKSLGIICGTRNIVSACRISVKTANRACLNAVFRIGSCENIFAVNGVLIYKSAVGIYFNGNSRIGKANIRCGSRIDFIGCAVINSRRGVFRQTGVTVDPNSVSLFVYLLFACRLIYNRFRSSRRINGERNF